MATETEKNFFQFAASEVGGGIANTAKDLVTAAFPQTDFSQDTDILEILDLTAFHQILQVTAGALLAAPQIGEISSLTHRSIVRSQAKITSEINGRFDRMSKQRQEEVGLLISKLRSTLLPPSRR